MAKYRKLGRTSNTQNDMEDMVNLFLQTSNDFYDLIRVINKYSVIKDWMKEEK